MHIETDRVALVDGGGVAEIELPLKDIRTVPEYLRRDRDARP